MSSVDVTKYSDVSCELVNISFISVSTALDKLKVGGWYIA